MQKSLSVDWITMHVQMPCREYRIPEKTDYKYSLQHMRYQTRHFKAVYEIFLKDKVGNVTQRVCTLACDPHSEILSMDSGLLKIDNNFLYRHDLLDFIKGLLSDLDMNFRSYSRLDVALDFTSFANKLTPENFISRFVDGSYIKKGRSTKWALTGETAACVSDGVSVDLQDIAKYKRSMKTVKFQTLKFGTPTSDISYYLYNKKQELEQVKMKPYIHQHWKQNGWDGKQDVWRLEFSFKSNTDAIITEDGEAISFKNIDSIDYLKDIFAWHFNRYFAFVHRSKTTRRKSNMRKVALLTDMDCGLVKINLSDKKDSSRSDRIFAKMLHRTNHELRGNDFNLAIFGAEYLAKFIADRGIEEWAKKKLHIQLDTVNQADIAGEKMYKQKFVFTGETLDFVKYSRVKDTSYTIDKKRAVICNPIALKPIIKHHSLKH